MRQAVSNVLAGAGRLFQERTILVLTIMFCIGVAATLWRVSHLQSDLITSIALRDATLYSQALAEFRTLYTSEVVENVRDHRIEVTHDYATKAGAIPLPATLTLLLGERISAHESGVQVRLYSPHPFPWRQLGGLRDPFAQEAWNVLQQHPDQPFYRFEGNGSNGSKRSCWGSWVRRSGKPRVFDSELRLLSSLSPQMP